MIDYAELQVTSHFTFLEGGSHPEELALTAAALGHRTLAITDRNTLAGVVRAYAAAGKHGMRLVVGCRLDLTDGPGLLAYPTDRAAYGRLCRLLTVGKRRAPKGECFIGKADVLEHAEGMLFLLVPPERRDEALLEDLRDWRGALRDRLYLAVSHRYRGDDARRLAWLAGLAAAARVPLVATNDVLYHTPARRPLQDVLTCIRTHTTIDTAGWRLSANAERHLKAPSEMARLFHRYPGAVARSVEIAGACRFSLDQLRYEYPDEGRGEGRTPQQELVRLTWEGAAERYPGGISDKVRKAVEHEMELIGSRDYAPYFLTVHSIVRFARSRGILCQGRGSAANSTVCYCLGITEVDPDRFELLFERFISAARNEPPDIDVDFEHERREEVIQHIYETYGRDRAGLAATVIRYRTRGALREVGKAMGLSEDVTARLSATVWGWGGDGIEEAHVRQQGLDPSDPRLARTLELTRELVGFPRHLSQHVGGFVITRGPLHELSPVANAAMKDRTTIEWDKDDIDVLKILKVDVLGLGMLSCLRRGLDLLAVHHGRSFTLATVPKEDPAVYAMLQKADSIGVFQVESRAQMSMLPRLRPKTFYDLVIQVAIVRPGPIQGGMVHPYLRRRMEMEQVSYPSPALETVLKRTLGVPLFQEQAMQIAIVGAGFSPDAADELRRSMASFRKNGEVGKFQGRFVEGMVANGYDRSFAERCFEQIKGFGEYGFPESHAASFALLVYVSAWMKRHHPEVFACALLNSQPMGFYAPAQLVRDAQEHGVEVRGVDVSTSEWDCTLEAVRTGGEGGRFALRLGFRQVKGLSEADAETIVEARQAGWRDIHDLWSRTGLERRPLELLARADAFRSLGLDQRAALWAVRALGEAPLPLFTRLDRAESVEPAVDLPDMTPGEQVVMDYRSLTLSLKCHPMALLRDGLDGILPAGRLRSLRNGTRITVAGLVLVRQRPGSANGIIFVTLEDETGIANIVVMPPVFERFRRELLGSKLMAATGRVEIEGEVVHIKGERLEDLSWRLLELSDPLAAGRTTEMTVFPRGRNFH